MRYTYCSVNGDVMNVKSPGFPVRGSSSGRPIMVLFDVLGQKWTLRILWELRSGPLSFRSLRETCNDVSPTLLNARLKSLRELEFVELGEGGYKLTKLGHQLAEHLIAFDQWAEDWAGAIN